MHSKLHHRTSWDTSLSHPAVKRRRPVTSSAVRVIGRRRTAAAVAPLVLLVVTFLDAAVAHPAYAAVRGVTVNATIDGKRLRESTETRPIRLSPRKSAQLVIEVVNKSSRPIDVRTVRLEGKVLGLTFFAYDTAVAMTVAPGATGSRRFPLDLGDVGRQATGLVPASIKLLDASRHPVVQEAGVVDVRGSLLSVFGFFGVGVALLTLVWWLGALVALARRRLAPERWRRALRFMTPGIGVGLLFCFTLAAARVTVPTVGLWAIAVIVSAAVFAGVGSVTPGPDSEAEEAVDEEDVVVAEEALPEPAAAPPAEVESEADEAVPLAPPEEPSTEPPDDDSVEIGEEQEAEVAEASEALEVAEVREAPEVPEVEVADAPEVVEVTDVADVAVAQEEVVAVEEVEVPEVEVADVPAPPSPVVERLPIVVPCHLPPENGPR